MPFSPHGALLKGLTATADEVTTMAHNNRRVAVSRGVVAAGTSGNNQLVAGAANYYIVVVAYNLMADAAVEATFRSASAAISGTKFFVEAGRGIVAPYNPKGWFATEPGEDLNLFLNGSVDVAGEFTYVVLEV